MMIKNAALEFYGYNPPFFGGLQNIMSRQEGEQIIRNDILQLLLTVPGERVMRPAFGVNLRTAVFENMDNDSISNLRAEIIDKLTRYEGRVDVTSVDIIPNSVANSMAVKIKVQLAKDPRISFLIETNIRSLGAANG